MNRSPLVSIIIPTYNMGKYVGGAIKSVLTQTVDQIEVIIIDDGSTDETARIVEPYLSDKRCKYVYQANSGQTKAKNAGINMSSGEFVGFCDADDEWLPNKLELQLPRMRENPAIGVVYTRSQPIDELGRNLPEVRFPELTGKITRQLFFENFIPFGTALVRRSAIPSGNAFNEKYKMGIDWELWLRLSISHQFDFVPAITYRYRIWDGQMSSNWRGRYDACFKIMEEFLEANPNAIPRAEVQTAYAQSFANRARARLTISNDLSGALADIWTARRHGFNSWYSIRLVAYCLSKHKWRRTK